MDANFVAGVAGLDDVVEGKAFGELLLAGWTGGRMAEGRFREWLRTRGGFPGRRVVGER